MEFNDIFSTDSSDIGETPLFEVEIDTCVDYRALNSLLPPVKKAFSKTKGILTLVPLLKIDEIYARLKGSNIYSTFDMRNGYYHMVLSEKSRPKSAFISSFGKWEFKRCPFG